VSHEIGLADGLSSLFCIVSRAGGPLACPACGNSRGRFSPRLKVQTGRGRLKICGCVWVRAQLAGCIVETAKPIAATATVAAAAAQTGHHQQPLWPLCVVSRIAARRPGSLDSMN
jgi:hypothetical protein